MINLKAFISALKVTWIRKLFNKDAQWQYLITHQINIKNICNLGLKYTENLIRDIKNDFWKDVLKSNMTFIKNINNTADHSLPCNILRTPIYFNENILMGGKDIFFKKFYNKGLYLINDFFTDEGRFYTNEDLNSIYNINMNFLQYHGIKKSIEAYLKKMKTKNFSSKLHYPIIQSNIQLILKNKKGSKDIYNVLNINSSSPTSKVKWNLKYRFNEQTWKNIFKFPFQKPISTTLQWFQTRINHRILANKQFLHKIKIKDSPLCTYCPQEETLTHMLWSCPKTQSILKDVQTWLFSTNPIQISEETFIFNIGENLTSVQLHLLLETKYYIFSTKHLEKPLSIGNLKNRLKRMYITLESIAIKNNYLENFKKDWEPYTNILSIM